MPALVKHCVAGHCLRHLNPVRSLSMFLNTDIINTKTLSNCLLVLGHTTQCLCANFNQQYQVGHEKFLDNIMSNIINLRCRHWYIWNIYNHVQYEQITMSDMYVSFAYACPKIYKMLPSCWSWSICMTIVAKPYEVHIQHAIAFQDMHIPFKTSK